MKAFLMILACIVSGVAAQARPIFLNLDPDVANRHPSDYGFAIASTEDGDYTVFTITLDPRADAAFQKARIVILGDLKKDEIPQMTVFDSNKPKTIEMRVLTRVVQEYALRVESRPIADTDTPMIDFCGYNIKLTK